ncbi:hypothetical protein [Chloroflexus sp.]|uniref:hypothetical protein n=1 Tax=Chloroflexus sp. TaxID=1904827 RepID=UPI002ACD2E0A|nr:hypothetical protein [Chloroflexus sp.]
MLSWRTLQKWPPRPAPARMRCPPRSEPITLLTLRFGFLPAVFRHDDQRHHVARILWIRDQCRDDGDLRYYRVRCADGAEYTLIHDLVSGRWFRQRERGHSSRR